MRSVPNYPTQNPFNAMTELFTFCISCNRSVWNRIFSETFYMILVQLALPLLILVPLLLLYRRSLNQDSSHAKKTPVVVYSTLLGMGLGGFLDGIVLHQILQWHQMVSNVIPADNFEGKSANMFYDGMFETVTWIMTCVGIVLMWHSRKRADLTFNNNVFTGGLLMGWGAFNCIDSLFNHYLFQLHNVRENTLDTGLYNAAFLFFAIFLLATGIVVIVRSKD